MNAASGSEPVPQFQVDLRPVREAERYASTAMRDMILVDADTDTRMAVVDEARIGLFRAVEFLCFWSTSTQA
jgi:hypothetical protein